MAAVVAPQEHLASLSLEPEQRAYADKLVGILADAAQACVDKRGIAEPTDVLLSRLSMRIAARKDASSVFSTELEYQREVLKGARTEDLEVTDRLGKGTCGVVNLARKQHDKRKKCFALKSMRKGPIMAMGLKEYIKRERTLHGDLFHPFIVNMLSSYEDDNCLYIMLEYINGGELFTLIREQKMLTSEISRLYAAELTLVFEYLHARDIAYRDLKPENVLMSRDGHVKLADFGFCKVMPKGDKTFTACGTPSYMAPEIIKKVGYNHGVDWWALGVLIFEMRTGNAPFSHPEPAVVYGQVTAGRIQYPVHLKGPDKDICQRLMHPVLTLRLGCKEGGAETVKTHKFFTACEPPVDWDEIYACRTPTVHACGLEEDDTTRYDDADEEDEEQEFPDLTEEEKANWAS